MAHRTNVIQVMNQLSPAQGEAAEVIDPVCGTRLKRSEARHALFRPDAVYYFCSKECQEGFIHPKAGSKGQSVARKRAAA